MAYLVEINKPRSASERDAQLYLSRTLPAPWIITTNVKERNFPDRRKPEIDSIVICEFGIFILDFKNVRGRVVPMTNQAWLGLEENLFEQAEDNIFPVKDLIQSHVNQRIWIESLIVLTHPAAELDWRPSDVIPESRSKVCVLSKVESSIRDIASRNSNRMSLRFNTAHKIIEALKPPKLGSLSFYNWDEPALASGMTGQVFDGELYIGPEDYDQNDPGPQRYEDYFEPILPDDRPFWADESERRRAKPPGTHRSSSIGRQPSSHRSVKVRMYDGRRVVTLPTGQKYIQDGGEWVPLCSGDLYRFQFEKLDWWARWDEGSGQFVPVDDDDDETFWLHGIR